MQLTFPGRVQIASGLTGSEVGKWVGDIKYGEGGKGQLESGTIKPGEKPDQPQGEVTWGDYENEIMRGVRSAMTGTMMTWRDNAADMFGRTSALRNGEEKGAWVRTTGGKHNTPVLIPSLASTIGVFNLVMTES